MFQTETNVKSSYGEFLKHINEHGRRRDVTSHCATINVVRCTAWSPTLTQSQVLRSGIPTACFFQYSPQYWTASCAIVCYAAIQPEANLWILWEGSTFSWTPLFVHQCHHHHHHHHHQFQPHQHWAYMTKQRLPISYRLFLIPYHSGW